MAGPTQPGSIPSGVKNHMLCDFDPHALRLAESLFLSIFFALSPYSPHPLFLGVLAVEKQIALRLVESLFLSIFFALSPYSPHPLFHGVLALTAGCKHALGFQSIKQNRCHWLAIVFGSF